MTLKVVVGHEEVKSIAQVVMRELLNAAYIRKSLALFVAVYREQSYRVMFAPIHMVLNLHIFVSVKNPHEQLKLH